MITLTIHSTDKTEADLKELTNRFRRDRRQKREFYTDFCIQMNGYRYYYQSGTKGHTQYIKEKI